MYLRRAKSTNTSHRALGWWVPQFTSPQGCCRGWPVHTACSPVTLHCCGASNKKPGYFRAVEAAVEKNTHLIKVSSHNSQDGSRQRFHSAIFWRPVFVPYACNRPWAAVGGDSTAGVCWTHEEDRPPRHPGWGDAVWYCTLWIPWSESWWPGLRSSINNVFINQNTSLALEAFPFGPSALQETFDIDRISPKEVAETLRSLPNKSSCGSDEISYRLMKEAGPALVGPLVTLFNRSLLLRQEPDEWKKAIVILIFKGGRKDRQKPSSYRPISLTSCVARTMEKIVNAKILNFFKTNTFLYPL